MAIPDIPGSSLDAAYEREKIRQVANLMKVKHHRYIFFFFFICLSIFNFFNFIFRSYCYYYNYYYYFFFKKYLNKTIIMMKNITK